MRIHNDNATPMSKARYRATQINSTRRRVELCRSAQSLTCAEKLNGSQLSLLHGPWLKLMKISFSKTLNRMSLNINVFRSGY